VDEYNKRNGAQPLVNSRQVHVVAFIVSRDGNGAERLAVIQNGDEACSLPSRFLDGQELFAENSLWKAFAIPSEALASHHLVHFEPNMIDSGVPFRSYWYAVLVPGQAHRGFDPSVRWMKVEKIARRLSDPHDLHALSTCLITRSGLIAKAAPLPQFGRRERLFSSPNRVRLLGELRRMEARLSACQIKSDTDLSFYKASWASFAKAEAAFQQSDYEGGWKCLFDAQRHALFLMNVEQLGAMRIVLEEQADAKLNGWRAEACRKLLKKSTDQESVLALATAHDLLADSQETKFYNIKLLQRQTNLMAITLFVLSVLFLSISFWLPDLWLPVNQSLGGAKYRFPLLLAVFVLGGVGASVSALMNFARPQQTLRVPDRLLDSIITLVRPVIGGACALVGCFFFLSGLVMKDQVYVAFLFSAAFAFGFSERLVLSTIGKISPS
jgi:hypothetical protein